MGSCGVLLGVRVRDDDRLWTFSWRDSTALELVATVCAGLARASAAHVAAVLHDDLEADGDDLEVSLAGFVMNDLHAADPWRGRMPGAPSDGSAGVVVDVDANAVDFYWSRPATPSTIAPLTANLDHALRVPWAQLDVWATRTQKALAEVARAYAASGVSIDDGADISDVELRPMFEKSIL